jgi:cobalt/nickel transport system permease protein
MGKIAETFIDISDMEKLAGKDTFVHRLDPRCKILLTLFFTVTVVSFNRYEVVALLPFFAYPIFLLILAEIPVMYLSRKLLFVSFFALMLGIANPILDREILVHIGSWQISGGWVSFTSIMIRFSLTAGVALLLLTTTGMYNISKGLQKLGVPQVFVMQLFFLCRYLFVLTDETSRLVRARSARSFGKKGLGISVFNNMLSTLFMRSIDRAERIYIAMKCRGFDGAIRTTEKMQWSLTDTLFMLIWVLLFIFLRFIGFANFASL